MVERKVCFNLMVANEWYDRDRGQTPVPKPKISGQELFRQSKGPHAEIAIVSSKSCLVAGHQESTSILLI